MKKISTTSEKWVANDWTEFQNEESCIAYEKEMQPTSVEAEVYIHSDKWWIYEQLQDKFHFDTDNMDLILRLKYILSEVKIWIKLNTETWEYEIISIDWKKI